MSSPLLAYLPASDLTSLVDSYNPLAFFERLPRSPCLVPLAAKYLETCLLRLFNAELLVIIRGDRAFWIKGDVPRHITDEIMVNATHEIINRDTTHTSNRITLVNFLMTVTYGNHVFLSRSYYDIQYEARHELYKQFPYLVPMKFGTHLWTGCVWICPHGSI